MNEVLKYVLAILIVVTVLAGIIYVVSDRMMDKGLAKVDQYAQEYKEAAVKKEAFGGVKDLLSAPFSGFGKK